MTVSFLWIALLLAGSLAFAALAAFLLLKILFKALQVSTMPPEASGRD